MEQQTENKSAGSLFPYFLIVFQCLLYGFGDPISKIAYESVPVFTLLTVRYWIAFALLLLLFGRRVVRELKTADYRALVPPCLCIAGSYLVGNLALTLTAVTAVAFLRSLSTVMTPLLALLVFRQKLNKKLLPLYLFTVVGLYLLCGLGGLSRFGLGELCALLTALLTAGALLFGERSLASVSAYTLTTLQSGASAVLTLLCALLFEGGVHVSVISPASWVIIAYLAVACTALGYLLQNLAMRTVSARTVALVQCLCPVMTGCFSFFLLGERLSAAGLLGSAVLLCCIAGGILLDK